ncbi:peptide chain release factor N(5)-glutamine methyltransferase [Amorphus sp. 3PC139-8]|uniref:peptide chain release factor N(5)-glutamine methyltransferase n=1 Tax=Amorphus sp. 3PC139-8 TaxID=2735676 RepID=UPI00345DB16C
MADQPSVGERLKAGRARLDAAGIDTAGLDARLLMADVLHLSQTALVLAEHDPMSSEDAERFGVAIERRAAGEPVGRIRGRRDFFGLDLVLSPATLEPRPDTETVVLAALDHVGDRDRAVTIVDIGTGTGAILLALLAALPNATGFGTDLSAEAAQTARFNAERLGLAERARFAVCDLADAVAGPADLLVSNPPYIASADIPGLDPAVRNHDPRLALDGGADGLDPYRRLVPAAPSLLASAGALVLEVGIGQADAVANLCNEAGAATVGIRPDLAGRPRAVLATWR